MIALDIYPHPFYAVGIQIIGEHHASSLSGRERKGAYSRKYVDYYFAWPEEGDESLMLVVQT